MIGGDYKRRRCVVDVWEQWYGASKLENGLTIAVVGLFLQHTCDENSETLVSEWVSEQEERKQSAINEVKSRCMRSVRFYGRSQWKVQAWNLLNRDHFSGVVDCSPQTMCNEESGITTRVWYLAIQTAAMKRTGVERVRRRCVPSPLYMCFEISGLFGNAGRQAGRYLP